MFIGLKDYAGNRWQYGAQYGHQKSPALHYEPFLGRERYVSVCDLAKH